MTAITVKTSIPGPNSAALLARRKAAVPQGPFNIAPIFVDHGDGATVTDVDGNTFLDFSGGLGSLNLGHNNPKVVAAVTAQAKKCAQLYEYMPLGCVLDVEQDGITAPMVDLWVKTFLNATGAYPIIYTSHAMWLKCYGRQHNPHADNCPLWVAHYTQPNQAVILPNGWKTYVFHQYTDKGVTLAHKAPLDFNTFNGDEQNLNELIKYRVGRKGSRPATVSSLPMPAVNVANAPTTPVAFDAQEKKR